MTLTTIPGLDQLAADPSKALGLPADVRRRLALDAIAVAHVLAVVEGTAPIVESSAPDRSIRLEEAAPRLGVATKTLARWTRSKPEWAACVVHRSRSRILLSASRFEAALREHISGSVSAPPASRRASGPPRYARFPLAP